MTAHDRLLTLIKEHYHKWGVFPDISDLANLARLSISTVKCSLREMYLAGLIGKDGSRYRLEERK